MKKEESSGTEMAVVALAVAFAAIATIAIEVLGKRKASRKRRPAHLRLVKRKGKK